MPDSKTAKKSAEDFHLKRIYFFLLEVHKRMDISSLNFGRQEYENNEMKQCFPTISNIIILITNLDCSSCSVIVRVSVVLKRTVGDSD